MRGEYLLIVCIVCQQPRLGPYWLRFETLHCCSTPDWTPTIYVSSGEKMVVAENINKSGIIALLLGEICINPLKVFCRKWRMFLIWGIPEWFSVCCWYDNHCYNIIPESLHIFLCLFPGPALHQISSRPDRSSCTWLYHHLYLIQSSYQ